MVIYAFISEVYCIDIDPRGIILVVGRVHDGFVGAWGGFWGLKGVLGGSGGVQRGLLFSQKANFAPLEVLYGTRFGSKHYIMVQLTNVY